MINKTRLVVLILFLFTPIIVNAQHINIDSLRQIFAKPEVNLSQVYYEIYEETKLINIDTSIHFLHQSIKAAQSENSLINEKRGFFELASSTYVNNIEETFKYAKKGITILPKERYYQCRYFRFIGSYYADKLEFDKVGLYFEKADSIALLESDDIFKAKMANSWAIYYQYKNENDKAISYYLKTLSIGKKLNDSAACFVGLCNIAILYNKLNELDKTKAYIEKAKLYTEDLPYNVMYLLGLEGAVAKEKEKDYEKALNITAAVIEIAKKSGYNSDLISTYCFQSELYIELERYSEAEKSIEECLKLNMIDQEKFRFYNIYALIKINQKEYYSANNLLEKANYFYDNKYYLLYRIDFYKNMTRTKAGLGDIDSFNIYLNKTLAAQEEQYFEAKESNTKEIEARYNNLLQQDSIVMFAAQNENYEAKMKNRNVSLIFSGIMLVFSAFFIWLLRKYNRNQKLLNTILKNENDQKQQLFTNIAHELQTPLSIISGLSKQMFQKREPTAVIQEYLSLIIKNSSNLSEMTNQILELSKIDKTTVDISAQFFSIYDLMHHLISTHQILAKQKGISLRVSQYPAKDIFIYSDVTKIKTIFNNVLSNAIKYTQSGGKIELSYLASVGNFHQIDIKDTGRGISKEELPYLFDRYYQTENKIEGGFGIGLAICKAYLKLLKGEISVKSKLDKGSIFSVRLLKVSPGLSSDKIFVNEEVYHFPNESFVETSLSAPTVLADVGNNIQILVVEDNIDFCKYLEAALKEDYALTFVHNGVDAMEYLKENRPALIITDWMMPSMDGIEFVQQLKKVETLLDIPVLMLTARSLVSDQIKALRVGIDDYLSKPFDEDILKERIIYLLNLSDQKEEAYDELVGEENEVKVYSKSISIKDQEWLITLEATIMPLLSSFDLDLEQVSGLIQLSIQHLNHKIKLITGLTAKKYIQELRYWEARRMLEEKEFDSVKAVCLSVGFKDRGNFSRRFKVKFGKYPKEYL